MPISIMVLDDHEIVHQGIVRVLQQNSAFAILGTFTRSRDFVQALRNKAPDLVIIDYALEPSDADGIGVIRMIRRQYPGIKILVLSAHDSPVTIALAMKAGADGYCIKNGSIADITAAIAKILRGSSHIPAQVASLSVFGKEQGEGAPGSGGLTAALTEKEREVLRCFLDGMTVNEIAAKFSRSKKTVSGHKQSALRKLGIRSDNDLFKVRHLI
ncbi:two-component system, NarL family, captular synthesis response regulator RcsB [Cupriavidus metallidurans]|jgi:DNA-binding NarL/FixJ family response regulator|uniref:response regulator transcription factor n=1 Tax=Cupriavidus TaxID=106589 RepID=UPI0004934148|nr:response regulator transcription factor [Cupriavidus metallidurans]AVA36242.1 DNA-binding response regulator [Cupriavidus metallidurans]KWW37676.1 Transcriptional regulatory protein RcsB [Cupriavidus metallidurans]MDE4918527.1 response regulator transcription factor [Cupriavidus metallidurans]